MQAIDDTLNNAFGQRQISTIYAQANQYRVILEAAPHYQAAIPARRCRQALLSPRRTAARRCRSTVARATSSAPRRRWSIAHEEQFPAATISFDLAPGGSLGDAVAAIARAEADDRHAGLA